MKLPSRDEIVLNFPGSIVMTAPVINSPDSEEKTLPLIEPAKQYTEKKRPTKKIEKRLNIEFLFAGQM
jgi:hypothetical protein